MEPIRVLLVEDNEGDIMLTTEALEEAKIPVKLSITKDGKQAIDFLNRTGKYADAELPELLLLDINLPKKNGHEVLKFIKNEERLKHIPVIMLTTSSAEKDIRLSHDNRAGWYITKPLTPGDFLAAIGTIEGLRDVMIQ